MLSSMKFVPRLICALPESATADLAAAECTEGPPKCCACIQDAAKGRPLPTSILLSALDNTFLALAWRLSALEQQASPAASAAAALGKAAASFGAQLVQIEDEQEDSEALSEALLRLQADLFVVFSSEKLKVPAPIEKKT